MVRSGTSTTSSTAYAGSGPPVTDETGCPDGQGRFNHFARDGSIYWHPDTGPFALGGRIRQVWAERGWERGPLGYPIRDQFPAVAGVQACLFENGALSMRSAGTPATCSSR
jgi:uncharacterized protein with LGFP repeats